MSRIGKRPVPIPKGVTVESKGVEISVKGPKGTLAESLPDSVKVAVEGEEVTFQRSDDRTLGFSHPVHVPVPAGLKVSVQDNKIKIEGADKMLVGQFAANVRELRPPEPYKGKGIRYVGEHIRRKVGKAGTA